MIWTMVRAAVMFYTFLLASRANTSRSTREVMPYLAGRPGTIGLLSALPYLALLPGCSCQPAEAGGT